MKVTMKDIANMAGVSKASVSRVINNTKPVSDEIRNKVQKAIKETDYTPSSIARSLAKSETHIIGLIIPDLANSFYTELVRGISEAAHKHGYNVFLCNTFRDHSLEMEFLNILKEKEVDALIFTTFNITKEQKDFMKKYDKPIVTVNRDFKDKDLPLIPNIDIDNFQAAYDATKHLIDKGNKKIGIIRADEEDGTCISRLKGYKKALKDNNLKIDKSLIIGKNFKFNSAYNQMENLLEINDQIDGMFCISDELASAAIKAILDHGLNVPEDISVIGFDDVLLSRQYNPEISTIHQPIFKMGTVAMETAYKMLQKKSVDKNIILPYKLIERESSSN